MKNSLRAIGAGLLVSSVALLGVGAVGLSNAAATGSSHPSPSTSCDNHRDSVQNNGKHDDCKTPTPTPTPSESCTPADTVSVASTTYGHKPKPCPTPTTTSPTPTPTETTETPTPTPTETTATPTPTPTETTATPTPTPTTTSPTPTPTQTSETPTATPTTTSATPTATFPNEAGGCPVTLTNGKCVLPKTGSAAQTAGIAGTVAALLGGGLMFLGRRKGLHA